MAKQTTIIVTLYETYGGMGIEVGGAALHRGWGSDHQRAWIELVGEERAKSFRVLVDAPVMHTKDFMAWCAELSHRIHRIALNRKTPTRVKVLKTWGGGNPLVLSITFFWDRKRRRRREYVPELDPVCPLKQIAEEETE